MHEMSLAEGVLQVIENAARQQEFSKVETIYLEIGQLAAVDSEALLFCLQAVLRTSLAEGARIELETTPGQAWCLPCAQSVTIEDRLEACPICGGYQLQITAGTEMRVKELDVV